MNDSPNHTLHDFRERLEAVSTSILQPELDEDGARQVSIVFASELPNSMHQSAGGASCPIFGSSKAIQAAIGNRRTGPGPVIVVQDRLLLDGLNGACKRRPQVIHNKLLSAHILGMVIHELGHVLDAPATFCEASSEEATQSVTQMSLPVRQWPRSSPVQWSDHDLNWIRATAHVFHRFGLYDLTCDLHFVGELGEYGCSLLIDDYFELLRDEVKGLEALPIREALRTPHLIQFIRTWAIDAAGAAPTSLENVHPSIKTLLKHRQSTLRFSPDQETVC